MYVAAVMLLAAVCLAGCTDAGRNHPPRLTREALSARAAATFAAAVLSKPAGSGRDNGAPALAPLLVSEVTSGNSDPRFGELVRDDAGRWLVDSTAPAIYHAERSILLDGVDRRQLSFVWWYPPRAADAAAAPSWRLLRMTLDGDGFPVVWEVFSADGDAALVFVSESLERLAERQFGAPLPGCRYAVERGGESSGMVVVGVLEDGPIPLGPMVYVDAESRAVTTVICRCTPAQVEDIADTGYYALVPCESWAEGDVMVGKQTLWLPAPPARLPREAAAYADENWLARALRLPEGF